MQFQLVWFRQKFYNVDASVFFVWKISVETPTGTY